MSPSLTPSLFPETDHGAPAGFAYQQDVITHAESGALMERFAGLDFQPFDFQGFKGNRRTIAFGSRYDFSRGQVLPAEPIPKWLEPLREKAAAFAALPSDALAQALIIQYPPGAGIGWHRDRPQYDQVVGVSLGLPASLRLRRSNGGRWDRRAVWLDPRSAYLLSGEVRDVWEHSIVPGSSPRYSVTFRTLR